MFAAPSSPAHGGGNDYDDLPSSPEAFDDLNGENENSMGVASQASVYDSYSQQPVAVPRNT